MVMQPCLCDLRYGYGTASIGTRLPWNAGAFLIGKNHGKDLINQLETLKDTTESQRVKDWFHTVYPSIMTDVHPSGKGNYPLKKDHRVFASHKQHAWGLSIGEPILDGFLVELAIMQPPIRMFLFFIGKSNLPCL